MVKFSSVSLRTVSRIILVVAVTGSVVGCGSDAMRVDEASLVNPFSGSARFGRSSSSSQATQTAMAPIGSAPTPSVQSAPLAAPVGASVAPLPAIQKSTNAAITKSESKLATAANTVTVGKGETLKSLSNRTGIAEQALLAANNNKKTLKPGTVLTIAAAQPAPQSAGKSVAMNEAPQQKSAFVQGKQPVPEPPVADIKAKDKADKSKADTSKIDKTVADKKSPDPKTVAEAKAPETKTAEVKNAKAVKTAPDKAQAAETPVETTASVVPHADTPASAPVEFRWPARGHILKSFGDKGGEKSDGINIALPEGTPIKAAENGVVAYAGNELKGYGNLVLVRHDNGYVSAYANNSELKVKKGDQVKRGQVIANSGQTGNVSSPQLHFELRKGSTPVDPMGLLSNN